MFAAKPQGISYDHCLKRYRDYHRFMAFIDDDEFIILKRVSRIHEILKHYERAGSVQLNWVVFGSSGHQSVPATGMLANYAKCLPQDHTMSRQVKTIANIEYLKSIDGPHRVTSRAGRVVVNASRLQNDAVIHHYMIKTKSECARRKERGSVYGQYNRSVFLK
jgi:hypothetical protein